MKTFSKYLLFTVLVAGSSAGISAGVFGGSVAYAGNKAAVPVGDGPVLRSDDDQKHREAAFEGMVKQINKVITDAKGIRVVGRDEKELKVEEGQLDEDMKAVKIRFAHFLRQNPEYSVMMKSEVKKLLLPLKGYRNRRGAGKMQALAKYAADYTPKAERFLQDLYVILGQNASPDGKVFKSCYARAEKTMSEQFRYELLDALISQDNLTPEWTLKLTESALKTNENAREPVGLDGQARLTGLLVKMADKHIKRPTEREAPEIQTARALILSNLERFDSKASKDRIRLLLKGIVAH